MQSGGIDNLVYYPYFRGKQFELITVREMATTLASSKFVPIIEPVRDSLGGLERALSAISDAGGKAIIIVNPHHGDHRESGSKIAKLMSDGYLGGGQITAGILLQSDTSEYDAQKLFEQFGDHRPVLIHAGFTDPKSLALYLRNRPSDVAHVFVDGHANLIYRRNFSSHVRILIKDGFRRQRNADYPAVEEFSELHVTYTDLGMSGFGDFLIVGDVYSEGGGPAYAVAIHLTFIDPLKDDVMYIYHFVSDTRDTPADPAGKFAQALAKLIARLDAGDSNLTETSAIREFRELHEKGHFPGLGYVKKLSMMHHIETLSEFFR